MNTYPRYLTIDKLLGETPLEALHRLREREHIQEGVPLAYAGRLDPMATGALLVLVGEECKVQEKYHSLDKEYEFEVLLGIASDTYDILGIVSGGDTTHPSERDIEMVLHSLTGSITLPYPHFSSKTVRGKPLHTWTLEGRLGEIEVPTKTTQVYALTCTNVRTETLSDIHTRVKERIATIPTVTDERKSLGRDFRRTDVYASWDALHKEAGDDTTYTILSLRCIASSGTYMRTLASEIGKRLNIPALAYSIHRTRIGKYMPLPLFQGFWSKTYARDSR